MSEELDLECSLCKDIYREPKTLGCLHSFCLECLEIHYERNHSNVELKCPICRTPFQVESRDHLSNLSTDSYLQDALNTHNLLDNYIPQQKKQKFACVDGKNEATSYCLDCKEYLCEGCVNAHKIMEGLKDHQINSITNSNNQFYCQIHQQKEMDLFCEDCKLLICSFCVPHNPFHNVLVISDTIKNEKLLLFDSINQV